MKSKKRNQLTKFSVYMMPILGLIVDRSVKNKDKKKEKEGECRFSLWVHLYAQYDYNKFEDTGSWEIILFLNFSYLPKVSVI